MLTKQFSKDRWKFLILAVIFLTACSREPTGFILELEETTTASNQAVRERLSEADLRPVLDGLNVAFKLPRAVTVTFREGGEGAFYQDGRIVICYDFLSEIDGALKEDVPDEALRHKLLLGHAHFVLYHEVGHALVDVLDIPIVGKEEDAVDGLATVIAVSVLDRPDMAIGAAVALESVEDQDSDFQQHQYWDEHSLNAQRYYNILCWVYGGAPEMCGEFVNSLVPAEWFEDKSGECPEEFETLRRNWGRLLEPHLRPGVRLLARAKRHARDRKEKE